MSRSMADPRFTAEQIAAACNLLEGQPPEAILTWAVKQFYPNLTMATAFGPEGNCIIHMLAEIEPRVRIFNLETGYQFQETLDLRERITKCCPCAAPWLVTKLGSAPFAATRPPTGAGRKSCNGTRSSGS